MAQQEDSDLPQTQSQSHPLDEIFSQDADDGKDVWGRLIAKHKSFQNVGAYGLSNMHISHEFRLNIFCPIPDLTSEKFTAGRATSCDYSLQAPQIKQKLLVQMSKRHFQITRDLTQDDSPVYIQVMKKFNINCYTISYSFHDNSVGSVT